ncbi:NTP transferase domain-containing protein [Parafrigoribacterium mesophilum]|uniref:NTP transferase domain-containing protein n=1 Tax=Parafrigoribacterium mesophilum TaxID=433646 RepID=UPI0031FC5449
MLVDALILAGGRSSRLDGVPKAQLRFREHTLLDQTIAAVVAAMRNIVVVGDVTGAPLPTGVLVTREEPPFSGPAAGIAAGLTALASADPIPSDYTLVLACDMPGIDAAIVRLLTALEAQPADGVLAVDGRHRVQPLAAAYRTSRLTAAAEAKRAAGILEGLSMFQLIAGLAPIEVAVPEGATDDVDTWADAGRLGVALPPGHAQPATTHPTQNQPTQSREKKMANPEQANPGMSREDEDELLKRWSARLVEALAVEGLEVDLKGVLGLAGRAAHSVLRPAAPLTTFVVGYAAGLTVGAGQATSEAAVKAALDVGFQLCRDEMIAANPDHDKR